MKKVRERALFTRNFIAADRISIFDCCRAYRSSGIAKVPHFLVQNSPKNTQSLFLLLFRWVHQIWNHWLSFCDFLFGSSSSILVLGCKFDFNFTFGFLTIRVDFVSLLSLCLNHIFICGFRYRVGGVWCCWNLFRGWGSIRNYKSRFSNIIINKIDSSKVQFYLFSP